ncbi:ATP-NAD kinase-like domain-containing protein [Microdochium bolleyi]|uniref:ATP-NAD kinase-like domain-containing protein n=1 Tax=Microdochium bolleyi TaxID=196109 RepID=A0A136J5P7_9PEZI|nr:ATP-NAD kinase-like domain-containing protein [Microdochium bolleyi]
MDEANVDAPGGGAIPVESIVFIRESGQMGQGRAGYAIFGLQELVAGESEDAGQQQHQQQQPRYKLLREHVPDVPQALLDQLLVTATPEHLRSHGQQRKVQVVVSTRSGTGLAEEFERNVLYKLLWELGLHESKDRSKVSEGGPNADFYHLENTSKPDSIRTLGVSLNKAVENTVVLLSGDGGVVELLNAIETNPPGDATNSPNTPLIAVLPLGTGNALFNSLHKKTISASQGAVTPLVQALRTLFRGKDAPLPCFRAEFSAGSHIVHGTDRGDSVDRLYGAIVASYGFHSQLVWESDTPEYRKHGDKRFQMVAGELLREAHGYRAVVEFLSPAGAGSGSQASSITATRIDRDRHAYILATMVSNLEQTFTISPHSRPLDNKIRLVHFGIGAGPGQGQRIMDVMMKAYDGGKHIGMRWTDDGADASNDSGQQQKPQPAEHAVGYDEVQGAVRITIQEADARWRKVCIDGTIVEVPEGGSMTVHRETAGRMRILVDPAALDP